MEDEDDREKEDDRGLLREKKSSFVIKILSNQEVIDTSQSQTASQPHSIFTPSTSFSQAFNFIKNSEFYTPPPPPDPPPSPSSTTVSLHSNTSAFSSSSSRQLGNKSEVPSSSSSAVASSSTTLQAANNRNAILVSHRQKGNPVLKHIRNVRWAFADVVCDYMLGPSTCALYLSLRYHLLHPDYLYYRMRELAKNFKLRIVLCHVDVEDVANPLLEVTKTALLHDCTLLCAWSLEECGRYLETIKVYENKPADIIQRQMDTDYLSRLNHALTTIRHVNKTDVVTLGSTFGTLSHIMDSSMEDLARCPGIGERKVMRLYDTFHEPFKRVIPKHLSVPKTATPYNVEPCPVSEGNEDEKEDANKCRKKEPEITIKSAISAAFDNYTDRIDKKNKNSVEEKIGESISAVEAKGKNRNCGEEGSKLI